MSLEERNEAIRKGIWTSFLSSVLFLVFAFILLFREEDIISTFVLVLGFLFLVLGCIRILKYFRTDSDLKPYSNDIFVGIVFLLFGGIAILKSTVLADMLTFLLGAYLIYKNANRLQICLNFGIVLKRNFWNYMALISIIGIILGCIIIINPFAGRVTLTTLISYCLIISEVIHIIQSIVILVGLGKKNEIK